MPTSRIVAMGGGGFSMEPDNPLLDDYVLSLTGKPRPRVLFVSTASGDAESYAVRFFQAFASRAEASWLPLFRREAPDLAAVVNQVDVIYVGGGSTPNLLACWRMHGLDRAIADAYRAGVILTGVSAGAMCWFEHGGITDSFGPGMNLLADGVGLLSGSFCPHYDGQSLRRPTYTRLVEDGTVPEGFAADDGAAVSFVDGAFAEAVSSRPNAGAWRVRRSGHESLDVRYLGA